MLVTSLRPLLCRAALISCILLPAPARAGGGAHAVDDAAVETPGDCHLESWITGYDDHMRLLNFSPACTFESLPTVEFGAGIQRLSGNGTTRWLAGPAVKWSLHAPEDSSFAIALSGGASIDTASGKIDTASIVAPVSLALTDRLMMNVNAGWGYTRGEGDDALYGLQLDYTVADNLFLMAEVHGPISARPGLQGGIRWTIDSGRIDIDLLAGRPPGREPSSALTIGFTIRR